IMVTLFGRTAPDLVKLSLICAAAGFFTNGAITGMYAIFARAFPTHVRASGTGFAVGVGRGGSVLAPIIAGFLFKAQLPLPTVAKLRQLYPWMYLGFTINAFSGLSLLAANLSSDSHNWMFGVKLLMILCAMINLELTKVRVFDDPLVVNGTGVPAAANRFAIASIAFWSLAIVAGRLTEYPNFVAKWVGFG